MKGQDDSPKGLNKFEIALLAKALAGENPTLATLRKQAAVVSVSSREFSGVGFFTYLDVPGGTQRVDAPTFRISDVGAHIEGLQEGAGFALLVKDGYLSILEGFTYDEPWPDDVQQYSIFYVEYPRNLDFLR